MTYRRRYLSGQSATTVVIAEGAITSDKIVDGAVTHPKISPGAVDSERVINESLKSEDIKDGEIKTQDIASGAVTTDKIASQAVTVDKLEASIQGIARPLTPGVDTAEIQDAKVTLAKLAPDSVDASKIKSGAVGPSELAAAAVEESRVKDGAISRDKIAGSAIDSTKIAMNAVTGSEILNGSVGSTELAPNAVETVKVLDRNITGAKIALNSVLAENIKADEDLASRMPDDSILGDKLHIPNTSLVKDKEMNRFFDDFMGASVSPAWVKTGDAGGSALIGADSIVGIRTGTVIGNAQRIDWGGVLGAGPTQNVFPKLTVGIESRLDNDYLTTIVGLWKDVNNYIAFYADAVGAAVPIWQARCVRGGNMTEVPTAVGVSTGLQVLEITFESPTSVRFDINGVEVANIVTGASIPPVSCEPYLHIETKTSAFRNFYVDYVSLLQSRVLP